MIRATLSAAVAVLALTGCATTYGMPVEERSRAYRADMDVVWEAALSAVDDAELALTETEREHGRIQARKGGSIFDVRGHVLLVEHRIRLGVSLQDAIRGTNDPFLLRPLRVLVAWALPDPLPHKPFL